MAFINELRVRVEGLAAHAEIDVDATGFATGVARLGDEELVTVLAEVSGLIRDAERLRVVAAGVAAARSTREAGQAGLAQKKGHRSPTAFVQSVMGGTRADAAKQVRLGESILDAAGCDPHSDDAGDSSLDDDTGPEGSEGTTPTPMRSWYAPLDDALLSGAIAADKVDAILRGLGAPPTCPTGTDADPSVGVPADGADLSATAPTDEMTQLWQVAAEQLLQDATRVTVETLGAMARTLRDQLDPEGAHERFLARYEHRSFRMYTNRDGITSAHISFDDEVAAWVRTILDSALRPRRGGPRFVDSAEKERAERLADDPRTNDQISYDLVMDLLRAGSLATPEQVYGTRQAGVRLVAIAGQVTPGVRDAFGRLIEVIGHTEDGGHALPGPVIDQALCTTGHRSITVDIHGNPLDVGREHRLYTPRQRIAFATRDGGCLWPECTMPASYCEAHHIDGWAADNGRTDTDRGILLCRFHHMNLHHHGWRISRHGTGPFHLHPPPGIDEMRTIALRSRSPLRALWAPPPAARAG